MIWLGVGYCQAFDNRLPAGIISFICIVLGSSFDRKTLVRAHRSIGVAEEYSTSFLLNEVAAVVSLSHFPRRGRGILACC